MKLEIETIEWVLAMISGFQYPLHWVLAMVCIPSEKDRSDCDLRPATAEPKLNHGLIEWLLLSIMISNKRANDLKSVIQW